MFGPTPYALTLFISEKKDVSQVFPILHDAAAAEGSTMTSTPGGLLVRGIVCVFFFQTWSPLSRREEDRPLRRRVRLDFRRTPCYISR
ncbi:hypothetical protein D4R89_05870 [bacterium]|nr:MAG: hypothetical protein D4R89_05870 [bacterium]